MKRAPEASTPATLSEWLCHLERVHPQTIALGLERVLRVKDALALDPEFPIVTVGGTNGKGSTCAMLESILSHAGYRVGCYTSPHLLRYNERVRISGREASDDALCRAFAEVERARMNVPLTYFEFGTLGAMLMFKSAGVEIAVLEVGLGGRLDAVNAFDASCAVVTTIDIDHVDYLGDTRDKIGFEKAGIFRRARPAICADREPPEALLARAREIDAHLLLIERDFGYAARENQWSYWGPGSKRFGLPYPALRGEYQLSNAAAALTALDQLRSVAPVTAQDIRSGLLRVEISGRFQVLPGRPSVILDVAHNRQAARALAANLSRMMSTGKTFAVFAILSDKDIDGVIDAVKAHVGHWLIAKAPGPRGTNPEVLVSALSRAGVTAPVTSFEDIAEAWRAACDLANGNDKILVFGSFLTVSSVMRERERAAAVT